MRLYNKRVIVSLLIVFSFLSAPVASSGNVRVAAPAARQPVRAKHGIVASTNQVASKVGVDVLKRGGNAIDAAVAVALALAVTYPAAGNLGGGGFMMIRLHNGKTTAIDYREMAPAAAHRNVYLDKDGNLIKGEGSSTVGYRASGVPGTVAGLELALKRYGSGKLSWAQLVEPARRLASEGFPMGYGLAGSLNANQYLSTYPETRRIFLRNGNYYKDGETFRQPELAATLTRLQRFGPREFYEGPTARLIAADMKRNNGLITVEDMRAYVAKERQPLQGSYRGYQVISMPPPSSGGAVLLEILNILERSEERRVGKECRYRKSQNGEEIEYNGQ